MRTAIGAVSAHAASPAVHRTATLADRLAGPFADAVSIGVALASSALSAPLALTLALPLFLALALALPLALPLALSGLATLLSEGGQTGEENARRENAEYRFHVTTSATE